ncbi:unnamed protein product, partial [Cyprideis torosa]
MHENFRTVSSVPNLSTSVDVNEVYKGMGGQKFEYDEKGSTFLYFLLSFLALCLLPATYYCWPRAEIEDDSGRKEKDCRCHQCQLKRQRLKNKDPWKNTKNRAKKLLLAAGWAFLAFLTYQVSQFDYEYANFDPYDILQISPSASSGEIKKSYRQLSKILHPDNVQTGDEKQFMRLRKAYEALTDETARRNWELYGNPDGPGAMTFGIALPSWIVEKENSVWVLGLYVLVFMVALPTVVGIWWYRSIQYSSESVLLDTTQLYYYFFHKTPHMMLRRALTVLAASMEFEPGHNKEIIMRPSDNEEVTSLVKAIPNLGIEKKERPLCYTYSIKARALLHSHLSRMHLPPNTLEVDRQIVVRKCPDLIQEMVTCVSQLIMLAHARRIDRLPSLDTVENVMKLSPMIVQALWESKSPLLQLPHVSESQLRHFVNKRRAIRSIRALAELPPVERRALFKEHSDAEYRDVMNVLSQMPLVEMEAKPQVLDDKDSDHITASAIVTVTVRLRRNPMEDIMKADPITPGSPVLRKGLSGPSSDQSRASNQQYEEVQPLNGVEGAEEGGCGEDEDKSGAGAGPQAPKRAAWQKNKGGGKKKKAAKKKKGGARKVEKAPGGGTGDAAGGGVASKKEDLEVNERGSEDGSEGSGDESAGSNATDSEEENERKPRKKGEKSGDDADDEDDWDDMTESMVKKEKMKILEGRSKVSHPVHAPYFPEEKQEYWWVYICDRKTHLLVTPPFHVTNLIEEEEVQLKFTAPPKPGVYTYSLKMYTISESDLGPSEEVPPMSLADTLEAKAARTALEVGVGSTRQEILSAYRDESWYCHPGNPGAAYGLNFEAWDPRSILQKMRRCLNSVAVHIFKEDANHMLGRKKLKVDGGKSSEIGVGSLNLEDELDREEKKKAKKREKRKRAKAKKKQGSAETNGNSKGVTECVDSSGDSEEEAGRNSCGDGIDLDACFVQRALKGLRLSVNTDKVPLPQLREAQDVDEAAGVVRIGGKWAAAPSGHADDSISSNFPGFDDVSGIGAGYQVSSSCHVDMPDELRSRATVIGKEGFLLAKAGQHAAAVGKFTDALNLNPTDRRLWSNRAQCHFAMGNYLACIKDCEEACRLNPDWALGYLWSGRALWRLLQWKEAERAFGKCRMTAPEAFQAHEQELTSLREAYLVHHLGVPEEIAFSVSSRTATIAEAEAVVK